MFSSESQRIFGFFEFWLQIQNLQKMDSEYIGIFWISCIGWLWKKKEIFFFFSAGVEIKEFWEKKDESGRFKKTESFCFDFQISVWICRSIAVEDKDIE